MSEREYEEGTKSFLTPLNLILIALCVITKKEITEHRRAGVFPIQVRK